MNDMEEWFGLIVHTICADLFQHILVFYRNFQEWDLSAEEWVKYSVWKKKSKIMDILLCASSKGNRQLKASVNIQKIKNLTELFPLTLSNIMPWNTKNKFVKIDLLSLRHLSTNFFVI